MKICYFDGGISISVLESRTQNLSVLFGVHSVIAIVCRGVAMIQWSGRGERKATRTFKLKCVETMDDTIFLLLCSVRARLCVNVCAVRVKLTHSLPLFRSRSPPTPLILLGDKQIIATNRCRLKSLSFNCFGYIFNIPTVRNCVSVYGF